MKIVLKYEKSKYACSSLMVPFSNIHNTPALLQKDCLYIKKQGM